MTDKKELEKRVAELEAELVKEREGRIREHGTMRFTDIIPSLADGRSFRRWDDMNKCWRVIWLRAGFWVYGEWSDLDVTDSKETYMKFCILREDLVAEDWEEFKDWDELDERR